jgi:hypothetical protein
VFENRLLQLSCSIGALAVVLMACGVTRGQSSDLTVSSGSQVTLSSSGTYATLTITGTSPGGQRSTFNANAPLTLSGQYVRVLDVNAGGILNVNADVTASDMIFADSSVSGGGRISLNSGTLAVGRLFLSGSNAFARTAGAFAVHDLILSSSASVAYTTADSFTTYAQYPALLPSVSLQSGGQFALGRNLVGVDLHLSGSNYAIQRNGHTLQLGMLSLFNNSNFTVADSDTFTGLSVNHRSTVTLPSLAALPVVNVEYLGIGGTIAGLASRPFQTQRLSVSGSQSVVLRAGAITDSVSDAVEISDSGTLSLQHDLVLGGSSTIVLAITGTGSSLNRNGFTVTTPKLTIQEGASVTLDEGFNVGKMIEISGASAPTTLSLARSIVLSGSTFDHGFTIAGSGAMITRNSGATITAVGGAINILDATANFASGDNFADSVVFVVGGTASNVGAISVATLDIASSPENVGYYTANAPLTATQQISVTNAEFHVGANVSADGVIVTAEADKTSVLNLLSGTLSANYLFISGTGSAVTRAPHARYDLNFLTILDQAAMAFSAGDSIDYLDLSAGSLTATAPLAIVQLTVGDAWLLTLEDFSGAGPQGTQWGFRIDGDQRSVLENFIAEQRIVSTSPLETLYDPLGNKTYITSVPEPSSIALSLCGIAACGWRMRQRRTATAAQPKR